MNYEIGKTIVPFFRSYAINLDFYSSTEIFHDALVIANKSEKELLKIREELLYEISSVAPTFKEFKFFMNDEFTLVDCCLGPILWRLPSLGIKLPINRHLKPIIDYQNTVFDRPGFLDSLSSIERDLKSE